MAQQRNSTLDNPLLFLEKYIKSDLFTDFINSNYINASAEINKEDLSIQYTKDYYENEPFLPVKVYFKDYLESRLNTTVANSIHLIEEKAEQIVNNGNSTKNYLDKQKQILADITLYSEINQEHHNLIHPYLKKISKALSRRQLGHFNDTNVYSKKTKVEPYFIPLINKRKIQLLYSNAKKLDLIDFAQVTQQSFENVFTGSNPLLSNDKILFQCSTREAIYFLEQIKKYFKNLNPTSIGNSEAFMTKSTKNKPSVPISTVNYNKVNCQLNKIQNEKLNNIKSRILSLTRI